MDKYKRVDNPKPVPEIQENEIRITTQGKMRSYIAYATNLFQKGASEVILKAMGRAINKTVTIAEIIKRRIQGLHQNTVIDSTPITEVWEPIEEGLERVETTRLVSSIQITLSNGQLDINSPGYQPPIPEDQIQKSPAIRPRGVGRGFRRGRGIGRARGGFLTPNQPLQPLQPLQPQMPPSALPLSNPGFQQDQNESQNNMGLRRRYRRSRPRLPNQYNNNVNTGINTMNTGMNPGFNNGGYNNNFNSGFNSNFRGQGRGGGRGRGRGRPRGRAGFNRGQFQGLQPPRFPRNNANLSNVNQQRPPQDGQPVILA